jgi:hypothetical protein
MNTGRKFQIRKYLLRILMPIVRLLIRNEISHSEFSEIARQAYVQAAYRYFSIPNRKITYSRVAVLTGLSRKEVVRLSKEDIDPQKIPKQTVNRAARVITGWLNDNDYLDARGNPMILPLRIPEGDEGASFATLVERYSGNITARAILDELVRLEIVTVIDKQMVRLDRFGFIPESDDIESFNVLSDSAANLLESGAFNITRSDGQAPRFQRQLTHLNVPRALADEFATYSGEKSLQLLLDLDRWLVQKKRTLTDSQTEKPGRIGLGIYYYEEESNENDRNPE